MRIHEYSAGMPAAVTHPDVPPDTRLVDVISIDIEERVYRVGSEEELDVSLTVVELFGEETGRVVKHRDRRIEVQVDYVGQRASFEGHPAELCERVRSEAIRKLGIDIAVAADLALRVCGSTEDISPTTPLGSVTLKGAHEIVLELVHAVRPQG
jgi:hypothetical protein